MAFSFKIYIYIGLELKDLRTCPDSVLIFFKSPLKMTKDEMCINNV